VGCQVFFIQALNYYFGGFARVLRRMNCYGY
jgi:hypothetical protein